MAQGPETVQVNGADGQMPVYVWQPSQAGPRPAIIVIQEIFGVDDHIRDIANRYADAGFVAAAPDLFYRDGPGITVPYSDFEAARGHRGKIQDGPLVQDLQATFDYLAGRPDVDASRIGITGFCFGGRVTFLAAQQLSGIAAAAPFYPGGFEQLAGDIPKINAPLRIFVGNEDQNPSPDAVNQVEKALKDAGKSVEVFRYDGAGHGFMCTGRQSYREDAAKDAWPKALEFFTQQLKP